MIRDFFRQGGAAAAAEAPSVPEQKASAAGRVVAWGGAGRVAWDPALAPGHRLRMGQEIGRLAG